MMPRARQTRILLETIQVMVGQGLAMVGSLALISVLSQHLEPPAFGALALGLTGSLLVNQAITSGTTAAIGRFFSPANEAADLPSYLQACGQLLWRDQRRIAVIGAAAVLGLLLSGHRNWSALALGSGVVAMASSCSFALSAVLTGGRHRLLASALAALDPWLKLLLLAVCWRRWSPEPASTLLIYGLSTGLLAVAAAVIVRRVLGLPLLRRAGRTTGAVDRWLPQMQTYARPYSRFGLLTWMQQASDRWALQAWSGPVAVAHYAVVYQLGYSPLGMVSNMLNTLLAPILYGRAGDASDHGRNLSVQRLVRRLTLLGLLLSAAAFAVALLLHRWLLALLVAPAYQDSAVWFPWMVLAGALFSVGQLIALRFTSDNRTAELGRIKSLSAVLGLLFNAVGAYRFGIAGVVVAQNLFSVLYLLWMIHLGLRAPARVDAGTSAANG
ncbi:MAG: hypothetical protein VKM98_04290 [Cyanobacteriota bacterium]|nr:hypothetical protein [Cyanobacteriota bacterium]